MNRSTRFLLVVLTLLVVLLPAVAYVAGPATLVHADDGAKDPTPTPIATPTPTGGGEGICTDGNGCGGG